MAKVDVHSQDCFQESPEKVFTEERNSAIPDTRGRGKVADKTRKQSVLPLNKGNDDYMDGKRLCPDYLLHPTVMNLGQKKSSLNIPDMAPIDTNHGQNIINIAEKK